MAPWLGCSTACGIFPDEGLKAGLALAGGFFAIESLGKSLFSFSLIFFNDFFSSQCTHFLHPFFPPSYC